MFPSIVIKFIQTTLIRANKTFNAKKTPKLCKTKRNKKSFFFQATTIDNISAHELSFLEMNRIETNETGEKEGKGGNCD